MLENVHFLFNEEIFWGLSLIIINSWFTLIFILLCNEPLNVVTMHKLTTTGIISVNRNTWKCFNLDHYLHQILLPSQCIYFVCIRIPMNIKQNKREKDFLMGHLNNEKWIFTLDFSVFFCSSKTKAHKYISIYELYVQLLVRNIICFLSSM